MHEPTRPIYKRPTDPYATREEVYESVFESAFQDDGKPSRDAIAFCGTAMLISGVVAWLAFTSFVGILMAIAGFIVFCMAWAKDKTNDE